MCVCGGGGGGSIHNRTENQYGNDGVKNLFLWPKKKIFFLTLKTHDWSSWIFY